MDFGEGKCVFFACCLGTGCNMTFILTLFSIYKHRNLAARTLCLINVKLFQLEMSMVTEA